MTPTGATTSLSIAHLRRIEEICSRYEHPRTAEDRDITALAATATTAVERHQLLLNLIELDIELRRERGEDPLPGDYRSVLRDDELGIIEVAFGNQSHHSERATFHPTRYQFIEQVGRGGIGEIWRVYDGHSKRVLAIKLLREPFRTHQAAVERLRREAVLTGSLQHPGIPPVYEHGQLDSGELYFSMKLVQGETLEQILTKGQESPPDTIEALGWFEQVAQAIAYAHSLRIVHRDLKPHNIMIGRFGEVQTMDWGMAKQLDETAELEPIQVPTNAVGEGSNETPYCDELTSAGDIIGTPHYMAPEQARGELNKVDERADVFGLGAILFQILTGRKLDQDITAQQIVAHRAAGILEREIKRLQEVAVHRELADLCRSCLLPEREERPSDAGVVAAAVSKYLVSAQRRANEMEVERAKQQLQGRELLRRQRLLAVAATAVVTVASIGMLAFAWQAQQTANAARDAEDAAKSAREEAEAANSINDFLSQVLAAPRPGESGSEITLLQAINEAVPLIAEKFAAQPLVEASVRSTLGDTYRQLGEAELAVQQHELALAAWLSADAGDELQLLEYKSRLSGALRKRGEENDLERAAELRIEVLERRTELLGDEHPDTLDAVNGLALIYSELEKYEEAEAMYLRLIAIQEKDPALNPIDRAIPLGNLADLQLRMKDYEAAEISFQRSLALHELQPEGDYMFSVQILYGVLLSELERFDESEVLLRKGLAGRRNFLGPLHRLTLSAHRKLCRMLLSAEQYQKAEADVWACWQSHQELYGPTSSYTLSAESYLIPVMTALGQEEELEKLIEETYRTVSDEYGDDHDKTKMVSDRLQSIRERSPEPR